MQDGLIVISVHYHLRTACSSVSGGASDLTRRYAAARDSPSSLPLRLAGDPLFSTLLERRMWLRFDAEAQELFYDWWGALEQKVRCDSGLAPAMVGHLSKYRSLMPTLAALFELADLVNEDQLPSDDVPISIDHARQAVAFCCYLESHAYRVYSCMVSPEARAARELARHIRRGDVEDRFTTRTVYLKGWSGLDTPERVRGALSVLEDWVLRCEIPLLPRAGDPLSCGWSIQRCGRRRSPSEYPSLKTFRSCLCGRLA